MTQTTTPSQDVQEMVAQADTGARAPKGFRDEYFGLFRSVGHSSNSGTPRHFPLSSTLACLMTPKLAPFT